MVLILMRCFVMCSKEGRGGTEGRPGSPTSTVDGTDNQPDPPKGKL